MLSIKNFSKSYSDRLIIRVEQLVLTPGVYWVKGGNGAGKTTLFRSLAGIIPCKGEIKLDDDNIHQQPTGYRRHVNYSEAEPLYPGYLTANDLIKFVGKAKQTPEERYTIVNDFGIDSYINSPCESYSSGMLKKVSLSMAFLGNPKLILLDEPITTLDTAARDILLNLINKFSERAVILVASHQDLSEFSVKISAAFEIVDHELRLL